MKNTISILGPKGTFSEEAAKELFPSLKLKYCASLFEIFESLQKREVEYAVVPIENSIEGSVSSTLHFLLKTPELRISKELYLPMYYCLACQEKCNVKKVKKIYATHVAFLECRDFLEKSEDLKKLEKVEVDSSAMAMEKASKSSNALAIGGERAANFFNLSLIKRGIQDSENDETRFVAIKKSVDVNFCLMNCRHAKTSVIFELSNEPSALYAALGCFALNKINLTKLESRQKIDDKWNYWFYCEFQGSLKDDNVKNALEALKGHTKFMKIISSYPESKK
jgi:prephenate dehydratase